MGAIHAVDGMQTVAPVALRGLDGAFPADVPGRGGTAHRRTEPPQPAWKRIGAHPRSIGSVSSLAHSLIEAS